MTYRDSTDDGIDSALFETGPDATDFELVVEAERIVGHLAFLATVAHLWKMTATVSLSGDAADPHRDDVLAGWHDQAAANHRGLLELLAAVHRYRIPAPSGSARVDGRVRSPPQRQGDAAGEHHRHLRRDGRRGADDPRGDGRILRPLPTPQAWEEPMHRVLSAVLRGDAAAVRKSWKELLTALGQQPLALRVLGPGRQSAKIVAARSLQSMLRRLLAYLPRLGLLPETAQLLETIQGMEFEHPQGPGAITEFDRVFQIGCKAIVRCLVVSSADWSPAQRPQRTSNSATTN